MKPGVAEGTHVPVLGQVAGRVGLPGHCGATVQGSTEEELRPHVQCKNFCIRDTGSFGDALHFRLQMRVVLMDLRRKPFGFGACLLPAQFHLFLEQICVELYRAGDLRCGFCSMFDTNLPTGSLEASSLC